MGNLAVSIPILLIAQATDNLDGFVARRYSIPTKAGYLEDSISDKAFQIAVLLAVTREYDLNLLLVWGVFLRELAILSIRAAYSFSSDELLKLRTYSILYAVFVRISIVLLVLIPLAVYTPDLDSGSFRMIGTTCLVIALAVGVFGLSKQTSWVKRTKI